MRRFEEANCEKRNSRGTHSLWHSRKTTKVNRKNQNEMIFPRQMSLNQIYFMFVNFGTYLSTKFLNPSISTHLVIPNFLSIKLLCMRHRRNFNKHLPYRVRLSSASNKENTKCLRECWKIFDKEVKY